MSFDNSTDDLLAVASQKLSRPAAMSKHIGHVRTLHQQHGRDASDHYIQEGAVRRNPAPPGGGSADFEPSGQSFEPGAHRARAHAALEGPRARSASGACACQAGRSVHSSPAARRQDKARRQDPTSARVQPQIKRARLSRPTRDIEDPGTHTTDDRDRARLSAAVAA